MGFLKDMLNPAKHLKDTKRSIGALARGDIKGAIDPAQLLIKSKPVVNADPAQSAVSQGMGYGGDPNDPAYGSFTKPFDVEEFYKYQDPGYAFRLQQGNQAVQNRNSAGSGALSGAAYKDLIDYNQNEASTEYGNAFNRYQTQQNNIFSRLSDIAHLGQAGAAGVGAQGTQLASNAGQFTSNAGTAAGAGIVGAGNALTEGASNAWLWSQLNKKPVSGGYTGPSMGPVGYQV
jgi:hypothetical protein